MGWTWTCFGGKRERLRRLSTDGRVRHKNRLCLLMRPDKHDAETQAPTPPNPNSLAAQLRPKSPARDSSVYEEPFQPKQVVCGSLQGSKLFRRKTVRRSNSFGSSSAFENAAKKSCEKKSTDNTSGEPQPEVLVDRLQEEVEALRKRLAEEEAEARKLRNEVCYLRSCGVLQSPERTSCSSIEKDSPGPGSFKEERAQRHWQSWLGLTLSPASRLKLEDQLRLMAAEEMSKNPGKGLTNGQKALIVASRLWQYQEDPLHGSQVKFEHRDSYSSDTSSCLGNNLSQNQVLEELLPQKDFLPQGSGSKRQSKEAPLPECQQQESILHVASFRDSLDLKFPPGSRITQEMDPKHPPSSSYDSENFSFHPSSEKPVIKDVTVVQRTTSFPKAGSLSVDHKEQQHGEFESCPAEEQVKFESPRRSSSLPNSGVGISTSDEARRFIDLRYQELEEKLSRSPKRSAASSPNTTPDRSPPHPLKNAKQVEDSDLLLDATSPDAKRFPIDDSSQDAAYSSDDDSPESPSTSVMSKPYFSCKSGRLWQPLSPVKEVDSGLSSLHSSGKDSSSAVISQQVFSDSVEDLSMDSWTGESKSRSTLSATDMDGNDEASSTAGSSGDVHDDDLFTLSPRRLHRSYSPWDDAHEYPAKGVENTRVDTSLDTTTGSDWTSSEDSDFDMVPIQCQSPDLSPKPLRTKYAKENELKLEAYPRDKYLEEMGLKAEDLFVSLDSTTPSRSSIAQKENQKSTESVIATDAGHMCGQMTTLVDTPLETSHLSKSSSAGDLTMSQDSAHPVLASIENLPKWIEYQGIAGPAVNKGILQPSSQSLRREETDETQLDVMFADNDGSQASHAQMHRNDIVCARIQHAEEPDLQTSQSLVEKVKPFPFEISNNEDKELLVCNLNENHHGYQLVKDSYHRYSPASDYQADDEGVRTRENAVINVVLTPTRQGEVEGLSSEVGGTHMRKPQLDAHSSTKEDREVVLPSEKDNFKMDSNTSRVLLGEFEPDTPELLAQKLDNRSASDGSERGVAGYTQVKKLERLPSGGNHQKIDRANSADSANYSDASESFEESCSSNDLLQSPCVSKNSEVVTSSSRGDEPAYSYDSSMMSSPTLLERRRQSSFSTLIETSNPATEDEANNSDSSCSERDLYPVYPAKGLLSISPDDRPILGTVATWWGDESLSKSRRWWDGQGIPNSTSKYKEDQRVNWHTTPFETRLEQALATQKTVPTEPCDQRNLFDDGVAPDVESVDTKDPDVLKSAARPEVLRSAVTI